MNPPKEEWYAVHDCPDYYVSTKSRVVGPLRMVLKPALGKWVSLRHQSGSYVKRKVKDLLSQCQAIGKKVPDPRKIPPDGFVKLDAYPNYYINPEGIVWSDISGKCIKWTREQGAPCPSVWLSTISTSRQVNVLLEMAYGEGAAEYAGFPAPNKNWHARGYAAAAHKSKKKEREQEAAETEESPLEDHMTTEKNMPAGAVAPSRKCHDCKRPTNNYRCPACLSKWRAKYGVRTDGGEAHTYHCIY